VTYHGAFVIVLSISDWLHCVRLMLDLMAHPRSSQHRPTVVTEVQEFCVFLIVRSRSEAHAASHPEATGGSFPGLRRLGREPGYSPPSSAEIKKT
jgi:hypothetical protein